MALSRFPCRNAQDLERCIPSWLARDPSPYALVAFVADQAGAWCTVLGDEAGEPVAAIAQSPGWPPVIAAADPGNDTPPDEAVVAALAAECQRDERHVPGLNGPPAWIEALSPHFARSTRHRMSLRLHRLHGAPQQPRPVAGDLRQAREADFPLLRHWMQAFDREAVPEEPVRPLDDEALHQVLPHAWLWWADGRPRSMVRRNRPCHGGWTIAGVYTPPDLRSQGWAGAAVHGLSEHLLAGGASYVALYTDLANPTSNALYARVGFRPVCDQVQVLWPER